MKTIEKDKFINQKPMKYLLLLICILTGLFRLEAQTINSEYDSVLAKKLEADDYGMKMYVLVILKTGTYNLEKGPKRDSIFKGHRDNIGRLGNSGKLVLAGPFEENEKSYQGIFILNVKTIDEAKELLKTDPAVNSKILDADLYLWYGSAAIGEYIKVGKKIVRKHF